MHSVITEDDTGHTDMQKELIGEEEEHYCANNATLKNIK